MKDTLAFHNSRRLGHTRAYFSGPARTEPRNLTEEMLQTLAGHRATAGGYYNLEREFQPLYGQLALDNQGQSMFGFTDEAGVHHPGQLEFQREGTRFQRAGDVSDVAELGPEAYEALLSTNPLLRQSLAELLGRTSDTPILRRLNLDAETELARGGELSPAEARAADQQSRAAFADLGILHGNQAAAGEVLNRDAARRARLNQSRQFATGVQGMNQAQNDFVGRTAQIAGSQFDPFMAIMNRSSSGAGGGGGSAPMIGTGARQFDPMNAYVQDLYNSNFNAENAYNIADAQADNANTQAAISSAIALAGIIAMSDERLKKNVKKTGAKTEDEIPIVEFEYKTDEKKKPTRYRGVMAQAVEKVKPEFVHTDPISGVKMVDYWGLGMPMEVAA